jgi:hypothetical protein
MEMDHTNRWLTLAANVGVIAGILFLAFEIQQSNRIAIASTEMDVRNSFAEINESIYSNAEFAEIIVRISDADADLTPVEEFRIYGFVLRLVNTWLAIETAYANGMVPQETYGAVENDMRHFMVNYPGTRPFFRRAFETYPALSRTDVFRTVERLLGEQAK